MKKEGIRENKNKREGMKEVERNIIIEKETGMKERDRQTETDEKT